jgi:hypothetical protein
MYSIAFTPLIFTKAAITQYISVDIFNKLYPNQMKNVENTSKISFAPKTKTWLSLYYFHKPFACPTAL